MNRKLVGAIGVLFLTVLWVLSATPRVSNADTTPKEPSALSLCKLVYEDNGGGGKSVYIVNSSDSKKIACVIDWKKQGKLFQQIGAVHTPLEPKEKRYIGAIAFGTGTTFEIASAYYP